MKEHGKESVVAPDLPKPEQERRVQDEIQKDDKELFGDEPKARPRGPKDR